ncbi:MAG: class I SAM-dependent methyltransferase [Candidatus Calescibacterium sp.]|nr:class I SAM-dependent methyltransferase [Candidatus Calescibacterium sp.]
MDPMSLLYGKSFVENYLDDVKDQEITIIDIGSALVAGQEDLGTLRQFFNRPNWKYIGVDLEKQNNVDIVLSDPYNWKELEDNIADVVITSATFEHIEFPWITIREISRILKPDGLFCIIAPSSGPAHRHPVDCWRILPDGINALAKWGNFEVIETHLAAGVLPWQHTFGVMKKKSGSKQFQNKRAGYKAYLSAINIPQRPDHILSPEYFINSADILISAKQGKLAESYITTGIRAHPENFTLKLKALEIFWENKNLMPGMELSLNILSSRPVEQNNLVYVSNFINNLINFVQSNLLTGDINTVVRNFLESVRIECKKIVDENVSYVHMLSDFSQKIGFWILAEECWDKISFLNQANTSEYIRAKLMWAVLPRGYGFVTTSQKRFEQILEYQMKNRILNRTTVIQHLIDKKKYRNYVEIGVERGLNFFQIKCPKKIAVDLNFKIPGGFRNSENEVFFEISSDDFFRNPPDELLKNGIDIALIDGGHTYKQSLKDILNCLNYLNDGGIMILHDCLPISPSCAAPTLEDAIKYPDFQGAWSGEVYKSVINIRRRGDLFCAVLNCDFGVGIVMKGKPESTIDMTDEEIQNLDFWGLMKNKEKLLNLKDPSWFWTFLQRV